MRRTRLCRTFAFVLFLFPILIESSIAQGHSGASKGKKAAEGEVLARFQEVSPASISMIGQTLDLSLSQRLGGVPYLYRFRSRSKKTEELVQKLSGRKDIVYAEPNFELQALEIPNDPYFGSQWALQNTGQSSDGFSAGTAGADISAVPAWDISTGGITHVVGIVDTGFDYTHPDLQANIWSAPTAFTIPLNGSSLTCNAGTHGFNAITGACDPMDDNMHGTHVSGIIGSAGNNSLGVVGVNWTTQMVGLKFLSSAGYGYASDAVTAIEFAIQVKAFFRSTASADIRILSNSWGGGEFSQALQDEIDRAGNNDMLFVAAAGNSASNNDVVPAFPASMNRPNMIAVAATDNRDALASFSNYGPNSVHLGAPGVAVLSTLPGSTYGYLSGTSMATPYVSGAAALMLSACTLATPDLKKNLLDNVDLIPALAGQTTTGGRLNVNRAIRSCNGPAGLSPSSVSFGTVSLGKSGNPRIVTLTNYQKAPLNLSSILTTGDFSQTNTCGSSLAPMAACTITVTFTPSNAGAEKTQLEVFDDAVNSPQSAALVGTGALDIDLTASTSITVATTSPGSVFAVNSSIMNQGTASAGESVAGIYLSTTGLKDAYATEVGTVRVPALTGGNAFLAQTSVTIPANLPLASYYVLTCADDTNVVVETNEANNCGAAPTLIQLVSAPLPDLIESSVSFVQKNPQTLQVTDTVANHGQATAIASLTQYYFSSSGSKDPNAYQAVGSRSVPSLAIGATSAGTTTVTVPQNMLPGAYYLLACSDDTYLVQESNENNNCTSAWTKVQFLPDLITSTVSTQTVATGSGATFAVSDVVTNQGGAAAAASWTQYYLSPLTNKAANGASLLGGSRAVSPLAAGATSMGSTTVTVPSQAASGSFYLLSCADDTNVVLESNESNNCGVASAKILVGPDLVESAVSSSTLVAGAGTTITISDTTTNQGGGGAAMSVTQYYLSPLISKTANGSRLLGGNSSVSALILGGISKNTTNVTVPPDMATGSFYLLACADDTSLVPEANESNNCGAAPSRIQVGADLIASAVSTQTLLAAPGATFPVNDTATNQGGGTAAASVTQYYLSPLTNKTANGSRMLGGSRMVPSLASGGRSVGAANVTVPLDMATGTFYLLSCVDDTNLVAETNESNNCTAFSTRIRVSQ